MKKFKNAAKDAMIANMVEKNLSASAVNTLKKDLNEAKIALLTSGGVHRIDQTPFDGKNGDTSYRVIEHLTPSGSLTISHGHYDEAPAEEDINVIFPMERLQSLVDDGVVGSSARNHYAFMGYIPKVEGLEESVNEVIEQLKEEGVDVVVLAPT